MNRYIIKQLIKNALLEDMNNGDITTDNLIDEKSISTAEIIAKEKMIVCGLEVCKLTFSFLDNEMNFNKKCKDGDLVNKGDVILTATGKTKAILSAERTALNFLQRMSGIATKTNEFVQRVKGLNVKITDTRKTTPNLRIIEKYSVKVGGGYNHRYNLSDAVMIKDNHIKASGGIEKAVSKIKNKIPHTTKIEIEVDSLEKFKRAIKTDVDIIMLDNMDYKDIILAVKLNNEKILETSGNITLENINEMAKTGVNVISTGAITHSVKASDISLKII
ncbi:MAG: carboxylating nicotinate-nucleotide diphosphorylase [Firmicutes bacterium]|nr:carboxylating nicotinate-nucleotide diphosphorylase [Bacillota bacterium]